MKYQVDGYQAVAYVNEVEHPGSTSVLVFDRGALILGDAPAGGGFYVPGMEMER